MLTFVRRTVGLVAILAVFPFLDFFNSVNALERIPYTPFVYFSVHRRTVKEVVRDQNGNPVLDGNGNPIYQDKVDKDGNPITVWEFDPPAVDGVTKIGFDISFNPGKVQILTDVSTFGFLCDFSSEGICPDNNDLAIDPVLFGSPLSGSSWSFNVDNSLGRAIFAYDFSSTPVNIITDTNFFGFQVVSLNGNISSDSDIIQNVGSSQQFCKTTISNPEPFNNNCGIPIPEPTSTLSLFALGALGAASTLKRQLKPSKSSKKETTQVG